jgi:hypothetical protein
VAIIVSTAARQSPGASQRIAQQVLDLAVQAAQVVVGPALNGLEHGGIDPQQEGLAVRHRY